MRRLRVFESISIDGYFTDAHGDTSWAVPVALGAGRSVFSTKRALRLIDSRTFDNGNVVVTYGV